MRQGYARLRSCGDAVAVACQRRVHSTTGGTRWLPPRRRRPSCTSWRGHCSRHARAGCCVPCWIGEDPDGGTCDAFNAYHFDRGTIRGIDVSGLNYVRVVHIPGNVLTPASWQQVVFVDEQASEEQRQAILDAYDGKLGGPLADLAGLIGETLGVELATITHEVHQGKGRLTIGDVVHSEMHPYAGPDGSTTTLRDSLFSTVPGSPAYVAVADSTTCGCRSTAWSGRWRVATRSRPTTGSSTRHERRRDHAARARVPRGGRGRDRGRLGAGGGGRDQRARRGAAPRRADRGQAALRARARALPRRVAGDGRRDDAAVQPAAGAPVRRRGGRAAAPAGGDGRLPRRLRARLDRVRMVRVRRRHDGPRDGRPHAMAAAARVADRRRHAGARRRVPVQRAEGPLPGGLPPPRRVPAASLRARTPAAFAVGRRHGAVLPGLLLGADAADVRRRRREPVVDGGAHRADGLREDRRRRAPRGAGGGHRAAGLFSARARPPTLAPGDPGRRRRAD